MTWVIASVPFWISGGAFAMAAWRIVRTPDPATRDDDYVHFFVSLALAGVLFAAAAWLMS